jgi:hypothetical protein
MNHKHTLETREAYYPKLHKKGKVTYCIDLDCDYIFDEVKE